MEGWMMGQIEWDASGAHTGCEVMGSLSMCVVICVCGVCVCVSLCVGVCVFVCVWINGC